MPVIEQIAQEYADRVDFVAVAWHSDFASTEQRAAELIPSGAIRWGLDESEEVFGLYEIPYQPWTVLVVGGTEIDRWAGGRSAADIRASLDNLIAVSS